jgi:O-antigen/teichoic acid export membrane protein
VKIESPATFASQAASSQEHFETDHLLSNLKGHTISSGVVALSAQGAKFFLNLASTMALARLLMPRDFGLVAMVTTVAGFLRVFKDAGLSVATVQSEKITQAQVSNLFWINVAVSAACTLILAVAAPLVAGFYNDQRLIQITLLLSATFLISGSTVQPQALLKRQMRFKALAIIEVSSMAVGVVIGVLMALLGFGYWSLVALALSIETAGLLLTWSISRWRPQLPVRHSGTGPLLRFGIHRTAADFISSLSRGVDNLLIGRFYGAVSVGLYSRANGLLVRPLELFLSPISAVFLPAFSRLQSQPERYRAAFLRVYEAILLMDFLFAGLLLSVARPVTLVILGPKWEQAAIIFQGFTFAALSLPLANAAAWLLVSQGRGRDMLVAQSINSCAKVLSFVAGLPYGAVGVAIAYSAYSLLVRVPIWYFMVGQTGPVRTADLWTVFFRHLPVWIVVSAATWLTLWLVGNFTPLAQLLICMLGGFLAGAVFICMFKSQRRVAIRLWGILQELRKNRRQNDGKDARP